MKKLPLIACAAAAALLLISSCKKKDDEEKENYTIWEQYTQWREDNNTWVAAQAEIVGDDGKPFYQRLEAPWAPSRYILIHWFNNREETEGNLTPLFTSTVSTIYHGRLYDNTPVDSSYLRTDALFNTKVSGVIEGWQIALTNMHVLDTVQIVVPYNVGYGNKTTGTIPPYSALRFNMSLKDIPAYEIKP